MNRRMLCLATCALLPACIPSNVVAEADRAVLTPTTQLQWNAPRPTALAGLYESVTITGDIAQAMWRVWYQFAADGAFSGAALVLADGQPQFQTLTGRYRIDGDRLQLGEDTEPAALAAAKDHLKLESAEGTIVLRKVGD
jgi:hypothetical protein